jgi:hypothetical protein
VQMKLLELVQCVRSTKCLNVASLRLPVRPHISFPKLLNIFRLNFRLGSTLQVVEEFYLASYGGGGAGHLVLLGL